MLLSQEAAAVMQTPTDLQLKVSNSLKSPAKRPKKPVKMEKMTSSPADPIQTTSDVEPTSRSPGPYRGKCLYQSRKCENERAVKRNGKPHNLCDEHRSKQNQHQRKFDAKKFSRKRRRDSDSDDEAPTKKHHQNDNQLDISPAMTNYPSLVTRLPSIQRSQVLPTVVYPSGYVRLGDAYPRAHVLSEYRSGTGQRPFVQESRTSQALPSYSYLEMVAASILVPPQSVASVVPPSTVYVKQELCVQEQVGYTSRVLPSLRVPTSGLSGNRMVLSPAQLFASGDASISPRRSVGNHFLPPLVPFGLRKSVSSPNSLRK